MSQQPPEEKAMKITTAKLEKKRKRKKKEHANDKRKKMHQYSQQTLGAGNMLEAVKKPEGEDRNEWLAANLVDFFNEITLLYGIIADSCKADSCPAMTAGPKYEYLWQDPSSKQYKTAQHVSAPTYIDLLFNWVEGQINDPKLFPVEPDQPFPANFERLVRNIIKRTLRVYGHIYHHHIALFRELDAEAHLNTCFKHLCYFVAYFGMVDPAEMAPLEPVIKQVDAKNKFLIRWLDNEKKKKQAARAKKNKA